MTRTNRELKLIFWGIVLLFAAFLAGPIVLLLGKSLWEGGLTGEFYTAVLSQDGFFTALGNSFAVAGVSAAAAVLLAFLLAYAVHYTRLSKGFKRGLCAVATLPMFLPTITYGFAIIYSFGKQGLITRLMGRQLFDIYGFWGLMVGYMIYTVPVAFLLIQNTMGFVDKKTITVSKVMGDNNLSTFWVAILRPLLGTLAGAFIQAFFLSFTDFGIPASVGGDYPVIATMLYNQMLGGIPDFNRGAVMAMVMLIPSIGSICILQLLERFNIRYNRISNADLRRNALRDGSWGISGTVISLAILSIFAVIFVVPLVEEWPYKTGFSLEHFQTVFADESLLVTYGHSVLMALLTAALGTLTAYGAALITARSTLSRGYKRTVESICSRFLDQSRWSGRKRPALSLYDFCQYAGAGIVLCEECGKSGGYHLRYQRRRSGRCLDGGSGGRKLPIGGEPAGISAAVSNGQGGCLPQSGDRLPSGWGPVCHPEFVPVAGIDSGVGDRKALMQHKQAKEQGKIPAFLLYSGGAFTNLVQTP